MTRRILAAAVLLQLASADLALAQAGGGSSGFGGGGGGGGGGVDLSLADARFGPDLLEAAARRAVEAWATAVDGEDTALERLAGPAAIDQLLYAGDASRKTRLVVRGPGVRRIRIAAVDVLSDPPTIGVELELAGRRYVEDRDTAAVVSGSRHGVITFTEDWILALSGPDDSPWRLVSASY